MALRFAACQDVNPSQSSLAEPFTHPRFAANARARSVIGRSAGIKILGFEAERFRFGSGLLSERSEESISASVFWNARAYGSPIEAFASGASFIFMRLARDLPLCSPPLLPDFCRTSETSWALLSSEVARAFTSKPSSKDSFPHSIRRRRMRLQTRPSTFR